MTISYKIKTLTPLWTGGVNQNCDRLHETSIIGSLRWWYEAFIRGLGVKACDPTDSTCKDSSHCAACELFGCTGWARKFRLLVLDENDSIAQKIESEKGYSLKLIPLKPIQEEEVFLLFHTLQIISDIGSIGGKTVLKPSEIVVKNKKAHHADYGLIQLTSTYEGIIFQREQIINYLNQFNKVKVKNQEKDYPVLTNFWFIRNYYLSREQINTITGKDLNGRYKNKATDLQKWMGGERAVSKKIFSFHNNIGKRTWGYAKGEELDKVKKLLTENGIKNIDTGKSLLENIFKERTSNGG
ncbi:MAG: type III-B CRISPR module RAMP protein Cmr1 [Spirochaetales bacterium]|nr:type III-B CRISPR module RAMP protein Cmr1 [Spirochaetales bacterium]